MSEDNKFHSARAEAGITEPDDDAVRPSVPLEQEPVEDPTKPDNDGWTSARAEAEAFNDGLDEAAEKASAKKVKDEEKKD